MSRRGYENRLPPVKEVPTPSWRLGAVKKKPAVKVVVSDPEADVSEADHVVNLAPMKKTGFTTKVMAEDARERTYEALKKLCAENPPHTAFSTWTIARQMRVAHAVVERSLKSLAQQDRNPKVRSPAKRRWTLVAD